VVLDNISGQIIEVNLKRGTTSIDEMSKSEKLKNKVISMQPITSKKTQPTPRISGSLLTPLPKHISGR
jgi:hypothetical protein